MGSSFKRIDVATKTKTRVVNAFAQAAAAGAAGTSAATSNNDERCCFPSHATKPRALSKQRTFGNFMGKGGAQAGAGSALQDAIDAAQLNGLPEGEEAAPSPGGGASPEEAAPPAARDRGISIKSLGSVLMLSSRLSSNKPHLSRQHEPAVAPAGAPAGGPAGAPAKDPLTASANAPASVATPVVSDRSCGGGATPALRSRVRISSSSDEEPMSPAGKEALARARNLNPDMAAADGT